jgi:sortase A
LPHAEIPQVIVRLAIALVAASTGVVCLADASWIYVKAFAAQELIGAAWERTQRGVANARPWPWADTTPVAKLTFFGRAPARDSPAVGIPAGGSARRPPAAAWLGTGDSLIVLEGSSGRNLAFGPTHDAASVLPGERGNSVIAAHRDTHFRALERLRIGDRIRVERADGRRTLFSVSDVQVVDSRRKRIALFADAPRLTLVTCYPFDAIQPGGPLRFVVTADLIAGAGITPPQQVARAAAPPDPVLRRAL